MGVIHKSVISCGKSVVTGSPTAIVGAQDMREAYLEIHGGGGRKRDRFAARFDAQLVAFIQRSAAADED